MIDKGVIDRLSGIVGPKRVLAREGELLTYASDGLPTYHRRPSLAVFPGSRQEVIEVVRALAELDLPFVPRGSGTGRVASDNTLASTRKFTTPPRAVDRGLAPAPNALGSAAG